MPIIPVERGPSDPTIPASKSADATAGAVPTIVGAASAHPGLGASQLNPSIESQDLLTDALLFNAPRVTLDGVARPVLGGIHLIAKLGQGGMGAVYYGINPRLETELAVKILPLTTAQNGKDLVERFVREARIAAKVRSPHIAAVYDVNAENGVFYIQMEYISGKSAGAHMRELLASTGKGMAESAALDICIAAADGLAAAHAEGIIHRDIKPDNIMLPLRRARSSDTGTAGAAVLDFGAAKLLDLGLARRLQAFNDKELTLRDTGMGTPGYMPPEQAQDAHSARETADVYSLGATLYALLAGHAPFRGTTPLNVAMATIQKPPEPIENTRKDLNPKTLDLLHTCLQKDPAKRPANGAELLAAMRACRRAAGDAAPLAAIPKALANPPAPPPRAATLEGRNTPLPKPAAPKTPATPINVNRPAANAQVIANKQPVVNTKPAPGNAQAFAELIGPKQEAPKPEPAKSGNRWVVVVAASAFFIFVVGVLAVIFMLIAYNSNSHKDDDMYNSPAPNPPYAAPNNPNNWKDPKYNGATNTDVRKITPPWNGYISDIRAYPTLYVRVGDTLVTVRTDDAGGFGRNVTSPIEGEVEEVFVDKGNYVTTQTPMVSIKMKK